MENKHHSPDKHNWFAFACLECGHVVTFDAVVDDIVAHSTEFVGYDLGQPFDLFRALVAYDDDNTVMNDSLLDCCVVLIIPFRKFVYNEDYCWRSYLRLVCVAVSTSGINLKKKTTLFAFQLNI